MALAAQFKIAFQSSGLTPGHRYDAVFEYTPRDGSSGAITRMSGSGIKVDADGFIKDALDHEIAMDDVTNNQPLKPSDVRVYLIEHGAEIDGVPSTGGDGQPLETTIAFG